MKTSQLALLCALVPLSGAALAGDQHGDGAFHDEMKIVIVEGENDAATRIELDSKELGFNLHDLAVGEQRSVVDKAGRAMLISRDENGFSIEVDGKTVRLPMMHGGHHGAGWALESDDNVDDIDVHVMHRPHMAPPMDGVTIISDKPVDEATQEAIRSMLVSAGHDNEVRFIDHESAPRGPHMIRKVVKRIEVDD